MIGRPNLWRIAVYYGILFLGSGLFRYVVSVNERGVQEQRAIRYALPNGSPPVPQGACIAGCLNGYGRIKCAALSMWAVAIVILMLRFGETGKLTTVVLDVGQGDGIFMKGPEGGTYLVDGGSSDVKKVRQYGLEPGNGASMVLAVQYGEFDMLLTGDVEGEGEKQLTKQLEESYPDCTWEILKVAHHGSKNSSTEEFLRHVRPAYALISTGQENRYGHLHEETVKRFADVGSKVYSTQENGAESY